MKYVRYIAVLAMAPALLVSAGPTRARDVAPWEGTWTGQLGKRYVWPVSIAISQGKVVDYELKGVAFPIRYSEVTPDMVSFGDRDNYVIVLRKTGDHTAAGEIRGRKGEGPVSVSKP